METGSFADLRAAGEQHFAAGQPGEAARCFRKAADIAPTSSETWTKLGFACEADGNIPEAVGAFKTAIGLDPQNVDAYFGIGMAYKSNGDFLRAISSFDQVLELRPNHARAKDELVALLVKDGQIKLTSNDHYGGEQSLERAYRMARTSPETVVPFVEHLIGSTQHKKAFDVINQARKDAPNDAEIKALGERMDNDPRLAHAKQITDLRTSRAPQTQMQPNRPAVNPDEVPCPCGASRVMKWATVCPTCNNRIGDPKQSQFASQRVSGTSWIEVCYIVMSVLWLLYGGFLTAIGLLDLALFGQATTIYGIVNLGVALGMLFQVEWVQFVGKILMLLNLLGGIIQGFMFLGMSDFLGFGISLFVIAYSGFSMWLIAQMSD